MEPPHQSGPHCKGGEKCGRRKMKILRFAHAGNVQYGLLEDGQVLVCRGTPFDGLEKTAARLPFEAVRCLAPVNPPNIICLGLNYRGHARECGLEFPPAPLLFFKATTALCGPGDDIVLPAEAPAEVDYEAELALVIGKKARCVAPAEASEVILGYTVANDVSHRTAQFQDGQWARGKSFDTFCPLGPWIATGLDGDRLPISCRLNNRLMQHSNTSDMIFGVAQIVAYITSCMTLLPGTVILTGTPEGVGFTRKPPVFLKPGDEVACAVDGIGVLRNTVAAAPGGQRAAALKRVVKIEGACLNTGRLK